MKDVFARDILQGRHAVITGAGSGICQRIAERFAAQGAVVNIIGRNLEKAQAAAQGITAAGGHAHGWSADVRDMEALQATVNACVDRCGPIDIVLAGAAGNFVAEAMGMSAKAYRTVIEIDLLGSFHLFRASFPHLRKPGAHVMAISAVQASMPTAAQSHVGAAKAGIEHLVRTLAIEWGPLGIRCNAISPGPVADTEGFARLAPGGDTSWERMREGIPLGRAAQRDEIADLALFLASGAAAYIHGTTIAIDGGQSNLGSLPFGAMLLDSLRRT
ncbi:SDR family oxidoreductase [Ramlibacter rhizophilus]|uniref:SDR family oxidoreductase n=1 Tax=Ramlibacter rhizophilus TaxID=1781167 RepID=A0A4Z0BYQ6_9BURK|nr:SDR family oxidoreductase [Ramlibacter rhizophilus]TFZ04446.1 SDR family oxidoreductase [Ramlibacter rhizophilus]